MIPSFEVRRQKKYASALGDWSVIFSSTLWESFTPSQLLVLAAIVLATATLVRRSRVRRSEMKRAETAEIVDVNSSFVRLNNRIDQIEVRLHDTFREMNARLDTKIHILNELIIEADRKIDRLRDDALNAKPVETSGDAVTEAEADDEGEEPLVIEMDRRLLKSPPPVIDPASPHAGVYRLSDQGLTPVEIAEKLGKAVGEIELILGLRRRRDQEAARRAKGL